MLEAYASVIPNLSTLALTTLGTAFDLPGRADLYDELEDAGWQQADIVVTLLRSNLLPDVELIMGKRIERCKGFEGYIPLPIAPPRSISPDDRKVTWVARNPRLPTTPSFQRFQEIKVGLTVSALLRRGVTRRDIREALRGTEESGPWMRLSYV